MNFVGLDLAWGSRDPGKKPNRTGIAVFDANGYLAYVGTKVSDDEIYSTTLLFVSGPCLVAIDAPLKVTNPAGQRAAEAHLGIDFRAFDAGPHPSNVERFTADPRGARVARTLDLDIDPHSTSSRRAIEVFPHPATVALFGLGRIFKFKKGTLAQRQPELLRYMQAIESLARSPVPGHVAANAEWNRLRQNIEVARTLVELNRAEDQIDAVMCAYIALYAEHRPDDITIYGDFPANGYILTPTLPVGLKPAPRQHHPWDPSPPAQPMPSRVAAESARCANLIAAVNAARTDVEAMLRGFESIRADNDTQGVVDLLAETGATLKVAEQNLNGVRDELSRKIRLLLDTPFS